jgi:hypothetical protein
MAMVVDLDRGEAGQASEAMIVRASDDKSS